MTPLINYEGTQDQFWSAIFITVINKYIPSGSLEIEEKELLEALSGKYELQVSKNNETRAIHYRIVKRPDMFGKN